MPDSSDDRRPYAVDTQEKVPATKTRPGGIGRTVFYILLASLALAAVAWLGLEIWADGGSAP